MANTITENALNRQTWASTAGLASLQRKDIASITGDTAIAAPTTATNGFALGQLANAIVPIAVTGGTIDVTLWVGFISDSNPSIIIWNIAPGTGALSLTAEGGWLTQTGRADRIAMQVVISAGAPTFSINIGGFQ